MPSLLTLRRRADLALCAVLLTATAACSGDDVADPTGTTGPTGPTEPAPATAGDEAGVLAAVPDEAREAIGVGEPRSSRYWITWSSCGEGSQAEAAAANGGRESGWILLDDLLADPGMTLGDHAVATCEEGIAILGTAVDPVARLAQAVLTAELNRNSGSESCGAADESLPVAQALLASLGYAGSEGRASSVDPDDGESIDRLVELVAAYNSGVLCR